MIFGISVYFSKIDKPLTFVPGCIVGFCSFFEWISWIILISISFENEGSSSAASVLSIFGFLTLYIINFFAYILFRKRIIADQKYIEWEENEKNKICS
jgi:hypothetical protein